MKGEIGRALRRPQPFHSSRAAATWRLRCLSLCASTEPELESWLRQRCGVDGVLRQPLAVIARRQRFGHGQRGRPWLSPAGGVWLSAALPWPSPPRESANPGLAVAVALARALEEFGLVVRIKWPNDLLVEGRKIAGLLPRLRRRGDRIRWAQVGVGLNGINRVPPGAISLAQALGAPHHPQARPARLTARVLGGLEWALAHSGEPETVRLEAERRLWIPPDPVLHAGLAWQVSGLTGDGGLALRRGACQAVARRVL